jgi:hypothetical protein
MKAISNIFIIYEVWEIFINEHLKLCKPCQNGAMTLSLATLSIMTLSITPLSITTFRITKNKMHQTAQ